VPELLPERLHAPYELARERFLADPSVTTVAFPVRRRDGTELEVEISLSVTDGDPSLVTAVVRDTVARRRLEAQLRQSHTLGSIGRLATGVAHDFNNALTSISAYAHLVLSRLSPQDPSHADVREIVRAAEQAGRLVTQLQAFSRAEPVQAEVVDLNQAIRDVDRLLRVVLGEQVELELQLANRLPGVEVERGTFEQAVTQLALNAREAMPAGGRLVVQTSRAEALGDVVLTVRDSGLGMDEQTRLRAFDPFFTTKADGESSGLGLTMVHALVERLGGRVELESEPGHGTVVRLHLPAAAPGGQPAVRPEPAARTVLMVEDEDTLRTVVDRILSEEGYRVLTAASGEEALELAAREPGRIDLLVSDVVLGGMTGPELATKLKARRPELKTLLMSGYPGMPIGPVDEFLPKPFSPFELARRIRHVLRP
jgi:two-component system cell cycle sensor histidine kinase/response regulator CckA